MKLALIAEVICGPAWLNLDYKVKGKSIGHYLMNKMCAEKLRAEVELIKRQHR